MDCNSDTADDGAKKEGMPQRNLGVDSKVSRGLRALICSHKIWISWDKPTLSDLRCVRLGSSLHSAYAVYWLHSEAVKNCQNCTFSMSGRRSIPSDRLMSASKRLRNNHRHPACENYLSIPSFSRVALNGSCMFLSSFYQTICQRIVKCVIMAYHGIKSSLRRFFIVRLF